MTLFIISIFKLKVLKHIQKNTCVRFIRKGRDNRNKYVEISPGPAHSDDVGFNDEKQIIHIGKQ